MHIATCLLSPFQPQLYSFSLTEPENPFGDDPEFFPVQIETAFRDSGYYDGVVDKSPFDTKPSVTDLINKGLTQKEATAIVDEIIAASTVNKLKKASEDEAIYVPGLDKCFSGGNTYGSGSYKNDVEKNVKDTLKKDGVNNTLKLGTAVDKTNQDNGIQRAKSIEKQIEAASPKPMVRDKIKIHDESVEEHMTLARPKSVERDTMHDTSLNQQACTGRPKSVDRDTMKMQDKSIDMRVNYMRPKSVDRDMVNRIGNSVEPPLNSERPKSVDRDIMNRMGKSVETRLNSERPKSVDRDAMNRIGKSVEPRLNSERPKSVDRDTMNKIGKSVEPYLTSGRPNSVDRDTFNRISKSVESHLTPQRPKSVDRDSMKVLDKSIEMHMKSARPEYVDRDGMILHDGSENININANNTRPKSLEKDLHELPIKTIGSNSADDSSPDSEYQSGKESLASDSENTEEAKTPGSEVESSVDTGETVDKDNTTDDADRAAENCVIS